MSGNKIDFIQTFLPESVEDIRYTMINLDVTDLGIADLLRNINASFPAGRRERNAITSGLFALCIKCKCELLEPLSGLIILITNGEKNLDAPIVTKDYIVITIDELKIRDDEGIADLMDKISRYLVKEFKYILADFNTFFVKYVYDRDEELE